MLRKLRDDYVKQNLVANADAAGRAILGLHPLELSRFLEEAWAFITTNVPTRVPVNLSVPQRLLPGAVPGLPVLGPPILAEHLVYAYHVEQTRVVDIFRRVLIGYARGEEYDVPSLETHRWLRTTEALFFRDLPSTDIGALTSWLRPSMAMSRRNAYYRLLGMEINHPTDEAPGQELHKPTASNREFSLTLEELLREVWRGIENQSNSSGPKPTDDDALATLSRALNAMLMTRRRNGNLVREEFFYVAMMSWFHMTIELDSPVIVDLKAQASSEDERLRKLGERVGIPASARTDSHLKLALVMSQFLIQIEMGSYTSPTSARMLYTDPLITSMMQEIITHYSIATGRDMKAGKVATSPRGLERPTPVSRPLPAPPPPARVGNGRVPSGALPSPVR